MLPPTRLLGHMRAELVTDALGMALAARSPERGLIHHSDRGAQYARVEAQQARPPASIFLLSFVSTFAPSWSN